MSGYEFAIACVACKIHRKQQTCTPVDMHRSLEQPSPTCIVGKLPVSMVDQQRSSYVDSSFQTIDTACLPTGNCDLPT